MAKNKRPRRRSLAAQALRDPRFRPKRIEDRSKYNRKGKKNRYKSTLEG